jgi:hypothetical protein
MRVSGVLVGVLLAAVSGCSSQASKSPPAVAAGDEHIPCALAGAAQFTDACAIERSRQDDGLTLIVRHPDGAFRRFTVVSDGRGLITADGSEPAVTALRNGKLAVSVGDDRYLFPATVKARSADAKS